MKIISWNVLYIEYEKRYNPTSDILLKYADDNDRIRDIVDMIAKQISSDTIICLQECSLQLVLLIKENFENSHSVFTTHVRTDEYLLTMTPREQEYKRQVFSKSNYTSTANGYLIVSNNKLRIINCHLIPQNIVEQDVLKLMKGEFHAKGTFIAGDYNQTRKSVVNELKYKYTIPYFGPSYKGKKGIDFIIFNYHCMYTSGIIETSLLSDHDMVYLEII